MTDDLNALKLKFHERMRQIHDQAWHECGYKATRFIQMVEAEGGLIAAKKLLASNSYSEGLTRLWQEKRLDISVEATVLETEWRLLFTDDEISAARKKLEALRYIVSE